jgi:uncharacterized protein YjiS (DUF1127 family)
MRLGHAWARWQYHRRRAAAIRELQGLDNRALRDIGLERSQIRTVVEAMLAGETTRTEVEQPWRGHPLPRQSGLPGRLAELG